MEYNERVTEQETLSDDDTTAILLQAFTSFPRLKHVVYGDYRNLALDGEDYAATCSRLFGKEMLPPRITSDPPLENWESNDEVDVLRDWNKLFALFEVLAKSPVRPKRLTIGTNKWTLPIGHCDPRTVSSIEPAPMYMLCPKYPDELCAFERIEELSLPVQTGMDEFDDVEDGEEDDALWILANNISVSPIKLILNAVSSTLRYLDLGCVDLMRPAEETEYGAFDLALNLRGHNILRMLLFSLQFPNLKHLKLSGWLLQPQEFLEFLNTMKGTLDFLELQRNIVQGGSTVRKGSKLMATDGGAQMALKGVIVDNYELIATMFTEMDHVEGDQDGQSLDDLYELGYQYDLVGRDSELESMWLGGRTNALGHSDAKAMVA